MSKRMICVLACLFLLPFDLAAQERATGYKKPTEQQRAAAYQRDQARNGGRVGVLTKNSAPPAQFDCVAMGWCPPIRDQGNCGSCYGVATADQLTCAFIKAGYQKNDDSFEINFQFGLDRCGPNFGGCGGGWGAEVAEWMIANGFPAERWVDQSGKTINDYPAYEARPRNCREKSGAKRWKPVEMGFCSGSSNRSATVAEIKACLMQYGVVNIAFNANSAYSNAGTNVVRVSGGANHETTLVGWDDAKNNGKGAWKTRGNWGTGLGDKGYVWMTYDSQLEDPFWLVATPLPPPPPPPPGPDPPPGTLTITPAVITLAPGGTQQFTITPSGAYSWSASAGSVTGDGLYTAPSVNGTYTVSANVPGDPTKYAIAKVTVGTTPVPVEGATLILTKPLPAGTYLITPSGIKEVPEKKEPPKEPEPEPTEPETAPEPEDPGCKAATYELGRHQAIATGLPLVVGVSCDAPKGDWLLARVEAPFNVWQKPCVIVSVPVGRELVSYTVHGQPSKAAVQRRLAELRNDLGVSASTPSGKWNPATQQTFQPRMTR